MDKVEVLGFRVSGLGFRGLGFGVKGHRGYIGVIQGLCKDNGK